MWAGRQGLAPTTLRAKRRSSRRHSRYVCSFTAANASPEPPLPWRGSYLRLGGLLAPPLLREIGFMSSRLRSLPRVVANPARDTARPAELPAEHDELRPSAASALLVPTGSGVSRPVPSETAAKHCSLAPWLPLQRHGTATAPSKATQARQLHTEPLKHSSGCAAGVRGTSTSAAYPS